MGRRICLAVLLGLPGAALAQSSPGPAAPLDPAAIGASLSGTPAGTPMPQARPAPRAEPTAQEVITTFDPRFVEASWADGRWKLVSSGHVIKELDQREPDAREAARVIRELQLTHRVASAGERPILEYWLSAGKAPGVPATPAGLHLLRFDLGTLRAEEVQGRWLVRDSRRILFNFGPRAEEAQLAVEAIRQHEFDVVGYVGQPAPVMVYFLSSKAGMPQSVPPPPFTTSMRSPRPVDSADNRQRPSPTEPSSNGVRPVAARAPRSTLQPRLPTASQTPLPDLEALAERVPIDWRQVQLRREQDEWRLHIGNYTLATLHSERDARQALAALRYYRVTEHCPIGRPTPSFSFYLANGELPRGLFLGSQRVSFDSGRLSVRQAGLNHVITDGNQVLLTFRDRAEDAQKTLAILQKLGGNQLIRIGPSDATGLRIVVRSP